MQCALAFDPATINFPAAFDFGVATDSNCTLFLANWSQAYNPNGAPSSSLTAGSLSSNQFFIQAYQTATTYTFTLGASTCQPSPACEYQFTASTFYICVWYIYPYTSSMPYVPFPTHESGVVNFTITSATSGTCRFPSWPSLPATQQVPFQPIFYVLGSDGFFFAPTSKPNSLDTEVWTFWNNVAIQSISPTSVTCTSHYNPAANINVLLTAALPLSETVSGYNLQIYQVSQGQSGAFYPVTVSADLKTLTFPFACAGNTPPNPAPMVLFVTDQVNHEYDVVGINNQITFTLVTSNVASCRSSFIIAIASLPVLLDKVM